MLQRLLRLRTPFTLFTLTLLAACATAPTQHTTQAPLVPVRLLALNDFHGQLPTGRRLDGRPAGGAAVLAAYLHEAERDLPDRTLIVDAGDMVGASSLASSLLHDEPTVMFLNQLGNSHCSANARLDPDCNVVGTLGNHEFDKGLPELIRLATGQGGNASDGPFLQDPWLGASFPIVSANVVWKDSGKPVLPPYVIKTLHYRASDTPAGNGSGGTTDSGRSAPQTLRIAFIGATVRNTPFLTTPAAVAQVTFLDEAEAVNHYLPEIRAQGVHAVVLLIHQGGEQPRYSGSTDPSRAPVQGEITDIVKRLDDDVAIVCSGHTHAFTNAMLPNAHGKPVLVTQALSYSTAFAQIDFEMDAQRGTIVHPRAEIRGAYGDSGPGLQPDAQAAALVTQAQARVASIADRPITRISRDLKRAFDEHGESVLGNLDADAQRVATGADFAFVNVGGLRDDLLRPLNAATGVVAYKDIYAVHPFGNTVVTLTLTGQQIYDLLDQQFPPFRTPLDGMPNLYVSGLSYTVDTQRAEHPVVAVRQKDNLIDRERRYRVATNNFLAGGGDHFTVFKDGTDLATAGGDVETLMRYLEANTDSGTGLLRLPAMGERVSGLHRKAGKS